MPKSIKDKHCPFKMTIGIGRNAPITRDCEKEHCAIWTGKEENGECAILLLALNSSTIIKHISKEND